MSKAPEVCLYCKGTGHGPGGGCGTCGFCDKGKPLDTQDDWDNSWGKVECIFVCPQRHDFGPHKVKWNSGQPWCLTCDIAAVAVTTPTLVRREDGE